MFLPEEIEKLEPSDKALYKMLGDKIASINRQINRLQSDKQKLIQEQIRLMSQKPQYEQTSINWEEVK